MPLVEQAADRREETDTMALAIPTAITPTATAAMVGLRVAEVKVVVTLETIAAIAVFCGLGAIVCMEVEGVVAITGAVEGHITMKLAAAAAPAI